MSNSEKGIAPLFRDMEKLLIKAGLIDESGKLTPEGRRVLNATMRKIQ